ncbi:MAG: hypothetical protein ABFD82_22760 [Syntrophaceae bacterium]
MGTKKQSPFIRGIENRLSTIFGEEDTKQPDHKKVPDAPGEENDTPKEISIEADVSHVKQNNVKKNIGISEPIKIAKSTFVRGIENRIDSIFEAGDKQTTHADVSDVYVKKDDSLKEVSVETDVPRLHQEDVKININVNEPVDSAKTPFIQGIEKQLDSIFEASDKQPARTETPDIYIQKDDPLKDITIETKASDTHQDDSKKDANINELIGVTTRAAAGHGKIDQVHISEDSTMHDRKEEAIVSNLSEHRNTKDIEEKPKLSDEKENKVERFEKLFGELITSTSIWYSPLKDLKSTVLSIEWEMTDQIMEKFDQEVVKLSNLFAEDNIVLGFFKILRFLGKYIKLKGMEAHHVSVKLLLSIYDDLENVLLTRDMTDVKKREILLEDINKYKGWVETVDLDIRDEDKWDKKEEKPSKDAKPKVPESGGISVTAEPTVLSENRGAIAEETIHSSKKDDSSSFIVDTGITPHEAFAYAVDEIKKMISAEFSALRAEIKMWRLGQ